MEFSAKINHALKWAESLFATRYSILSGAFLLLLPLLAFVVWPSLFGGLFVLDTAPQFATLVWLSAMDGLMVISTFRVTQINAPARLGVFPIPGQQFGKSCWTILMFFTFYLPTCAGVASWVQQASRAEFLMTILIGCGAGLALALATGIVLAILQRFLLPPEITTAGLLPFESLACRVRTSRHALAVWRYLAEWLPWSGYTRVTENGRELTPGHAQLALILAFLSTVYIGCYAHDIVQGTVPHEFAPIPAIGYMLVVVLGVGSALSGAAFFLDYYRLPTLGIVGLAFAGVFVAFDADHYFEIYPQHAAARSDVSAGPLKFDNVFENWVFPEGPDGKRTMVVVTASGGGIQSAAWTAKVLTGLDEELANFSESVGLVSSVSGGSVGSMYYLHHRGARGNSSKTSLTISEESRRAINHDARASSMESIAWGLAFPDLLRSVSPLLVANDLHDRGWALEMDWRDRLKKRDKGVGSYFGQWQSLIKSGRMPIAVFNSTVTETGQRLLISPVVNSDQPPQSPSDPVELLQRYPQSNLCITTAARLSATFPFVTPISCPLLPDAPQTSQASFHAADGGYADNEGIVTAASWIEDLLTSYREHHRRPPFDRILVVRVEPFAKSKTATETEAWDGVISAVAGPLLALGNVRGTSQVERGNLELELLERANREREAHHVRRLQREMNSLAEQTADTLKQQTSAPAETANQLDASRASIRASGNGKDHASVSDLKQQANIHSATLGTLCDQCGSEIVQQRAADWESLRERLRSFGDVVEVRSVVFQFQTRRPNAKMPPLSWKLTPQDKKRIDDAWNLLVDRELAVNEEATLPDVGVSLSPHHLKSYFSARENTRTARSASAAIPR